MNSFCQIEVTPVTASWFKVLSKVMALKLNIFYTYGIQGWGQLL